MKQCWVCGEERSEDMFPPNVGWIAEHELQGVCLTCLDDLDAMWEMLNDE